MELSVSEKIRIITKRRGMTIGGLAEALGQTRQNFQNKLRRDSFPTKELEEIAKALDCTLKVEFTTNDTNEII